MPHFVGPVRGKRGRRKETGRERKERKKEIEGGGLAECLKWLPCNPEALSSNPSASKKKKKRTPTNPVK
jgi:hypothetical protein